MPYVILATDHIDIDDQRAEVRQEHFEYLKSHAAVLLASGALLDDDGKTVIGGMTILNVESRNEAERFESEDPYAKAGLRKRVEIFRYRRPWWEGDFDMTRDGPAVG